MFGFPPVLAHFIADWLWQSQYMAEKKLNAWRPALLHVTVYGLVFWALVGPPLPALAVIVGTHYLIDRYRLARHINWAANFIAPIRRIKLDPPLRRYRPLSPEGPMGWTIKRHVWRSDNPPWSQCSTYGSPPGVPDHIAFLVMIAIDQILHLVANYVALRWLG